MRPARGRTRAPVRGVSGGDRDDAFARRDREALGDLLSRAVALARRWTDDSASARRPILPAIDGASLKALIEEPLPRRGATAAALMRDLRRKVLPFLRDNGHPRFFGYVMSPASGAGVAGDLLASALEQNVTAWRSAPAATELERLVVGWLGRIAGLPRGCSGLLTSGGSMATLAALAVARARHEPPETRRGGLGRLGGRLMTLYASEQVHMSVPRAAALLGLGSDSVRLVRTGPDFRMDVAALEAAVAADRRAGHIPFCVVASAGTVNTGAVDPLGRVAAAARRHALWMHVDAAYGGPLALTPSGRRLLAGMGRADSVAMDPHKWLYAPLDVGCVLFRDASAPAAAFAQHGEYAAVLEAGDRESFAFFQNGPELSRRFRALKVWMILKHHGAAALARRIARDASLARRFAARVRSHPDLELAAPVATSIVCFRFAPRGDGSVRLTEERLDALNRRLLLRLQRGGLVYFTNARLRGRFVLRACLVNFRTTAADVDLAVSETAAEGRRLLGVSGPPERRTARRSRTGPPAARWRSGSSSSRGPRRR